MGRLKSIYSGIVLSAGMFAAASAFAATELRFATAAPPQTPWGAWINGIAERVDEISKGELKLQVFFSSQLGDEQTVIRQVVRGRIDISGNSNTATSLVVPEFALLAAPYLWSSATHSDCAFDKHVGSIYGQMLEEKGLVLLTWLEVGQMIIFNRKEVRTPADLQGYKIRVAPTRASALFFEAVGANGVPLGTTDALPSLKTGNVNGATWPIVYGIAVGTHKMAPNVTITNHSHQVGTVTISKKVWEKLSADEQGWLKTAFQEVGHLREGVRKAEAGLVGKIEAAGVPVYRPNAEEIGLWREAAVPARDKLVAEMGGGAEGIWQKILDAQKACAE